VDHIKDRNITLDFLRFIAAMSVVIYHFKTDYISTLPTASSLASNLYAVTKFGYMGVDLFFLTSGFVIFASAMNRDAAAFAISRFTRVYPTFWLCMSVTALVLIFLPDHPTQITLTAYLANFTLLHDYLGQRAIDGVYWTLVAELKFYVCIFLLLLSGVFRHYRVWLTLWLAMTLLFFTAQQPFFMGWFVDPHYSPYFIAGIVFYLSMKHGFNKFYSGALLVTYVLACVFGFYNIDDFASNNSLFDRIVVMVIITAFYLAFYAIANHKINFTYRKVIFVLGGMTYPLYLLHSAIGKRLFNHYRDDINPLLLLSLITVGMLFAAYLVHHYFEKAVINKLKQLLFNQWDHIKAYRLKWDWISRT